LYALECKALLTLAADRSLWLAGPRIIRLVLGLSARRSVENYSLMRSIVLTTFVHKISNKVSGVLHEISM